MSSADSSPDTSRISDVDLLSELRRLAGELDKAPTQNEMDDLGAYSSTTYKHRWGWNGAIERIGLDPRPPHRPPETAYEISDEELLDDFRDLADKLGHTPSHSEINEHRSYNSQMYYDRFGGVINAAEKLGLPPNDRPPASSEELLNTLQELGEELGRPPTPEDVRDSTNQRVDLYFKRWDSWWIPLSLASVSAIDFGIVSDDTPEPIDGDTSDTEETDNTRDSTVDTGSSLTPSGADYVRHNAHTIANLPPAGERWTLTELKERHENHNAPIPDHQSFPGWEVSGILERVGTRQFDDGKDRAVWTVTPIAYSRAQSIDESTPHLGCCPDATGFRNLGDGEFECTNDACNATHSRERVKEVFMGGS